jgi:hypothetical protein
MEDVPALHELIPNGRIHLDERLDLMQNETSGLVRADLKGILHISINTLR